MTFPDARYGKRIDSRGPVVVRAAITPAMRAWFFVGRTRGFATAFRVAIPVATRAGSSADFTLPSRVAAESCFSRRAPPWFLRHRQAAGPRPDFGTRTVTVHAGALAAFDHLGSTHPDVGHEVAGSRPHQVTQEFVVIE